MAAAIFAATPAQAYVSWYDIELVEESIERETGTPVSWSRNGGSCKPSNDGGVVLGYFTPSANTITMCRNPRIRDSTILNTLMHEGWHSVQDRCTKRPYFSDREIKRHLLPSDKRELRKFYSRKQYRAEAEARAVANRYEDDPYGYIDLIEEVCS
jgi:hypothetical protein